MNSLSSTYHFGFDRATVSIAIKNIENNPTLFTSGDRSKRDKDNILTIGPTRVESLKVWLTSMQLISLNPEKKEHNLTDIGKVVVTFDSTVETLGSWAIIQYGLYQNMVVWNWYFNLAEQTNTNETLLEDLGKTCSSLSEKTIKNGLMSLLAAMKSTPLGSKFNYFVKKNEIFYKGEPPVDAVHPLIFAFCIMDWMRRNNRIDVHSSELFEEGGPARIFNLSSNRVSELLMQIREKYGKSILWHSTTAGLNSVSADNNLDPLIPLIAYYKQEVDGYYPPEDLDEAKKYFNEHIARRKEEVGA